ncbi:MAG: flagellar hook-associated protein FlgK [Syntrophobacterales bacterium]|jgi:flagellar hook-associated protein 1 FlgK|nr:flagellar hook-associated protein FlgK [Syntrophobacterales bacterium]
MSIGSILYTSKDALMAHQMAVDVTGANIANVNTAGYSRQAINMVSTGVTNVAAKIYQNGVDVASVTRIYNSYLEAQIVEQKGLTGYSQTKAEILSVMEAIFDESKPGGLSDLMNRFWADWQELSMNPGGMAEREALASSAEAVTSMFRSINNGLYSISSNVERDVAYAVGEINALIADIADLNNKIISSSSGTGDRNILEDQRMELVKQLSALADVHVIEGDYGTIKVYLKNGETLVDGVITRSLALEPQAGNPTVSDIVFADNPSSPLTSVITQGKLGALLEIRDVTIPYYMNQMNDFAKALVYEVNVVHQAGFGADQSTGLNFFECTVGAEAVTLRVNPAILADVRLIAASSSVSGDGSNALAISLLQDKRTINNQTFSNYYGGVVGQIGRQVADSQRTLIHQSLVLDRLNNQRESVSGVSIDEEMIKLIQYQLGYNAAAKLCAAAQEMLDTLLQMKQ